MSADAQLTITRRFRATAERLFAAWTDPALAARWLFTGPDSEDHRVEMDARVGGQWKITDRRGGVDYVAVGEYVELAPPRRLVLTFGMPQFSPAFTRLTIEIAEDPHGAVMTLIQQDLRPEDVAALESGWEQMFDGLERALAPVRAPHPL